MKKRVFDLRALICKLILEGLTPFTQVWIALTRYSLSLPPLFQFSLASTPLIRLSLPTAPPRRLVKISSSFVVAKPMVHSQTLSPSLVSGIDTADHFSLLKGLLTWPQDSCFPPPIPATPSQYLCLVPLHLPNLLTWSTWSMQLGPLLRPVWTHSAGNVMHLRTLYSNLDAEDSPLHTSTHPSLLTPSTVMSLIGTRLECQVFRTYPKTDHSWSFFQYLTNFTLSHFSWW